MTRKVAHKVCPGKNGRGFGSIRDCRTKMDTQSFSTERDHKGNCAVSQKSTASWRYFTKLKVKFITAIRAWTHTHIHDFEGSYGHCFTKKNPCKLFLLYIIAGTQVRDDGCHFFTGFQVHHVIRAPFLLFLLYIHSAPLARMRDVRMFVQCMPLQMILASIIRPTDPTYPLPLHDHFCK